MNDTSPNAERTYRAMLLGRSGAERLKMGCSMFATARTLVVAGLRSNAPRASPATVRQALEEIQANPERIPITEGPFPPRGLSGPNQR